MNRDHRFKNTNRMYPFQLLRGLAGALVAGLLIISCKGVTATQEPLYSLESLAAALEQAGAQVGFGDQPGVSALGLAAQSLDLNGEQLWVYTSPEALDPMKVRAAFNEDQFVWANEKLIVQYGGKDGGTILVLEALLGEALIRPAAAGDEPYPPAVPMAIRQVAEALGAQPAEMEVLSYELRDWGDDCLELGSPGEVCTSQVVPGWYIALRFAGQEIAAHTDLLGEVVRWTTP